MCSTKLMAFALLLSVPSATLYASCLEGETVLLSPSRFPLGPRLQSIPLKNHFPVSPAKLEKLHGSPWNMGATSSPSKRMRVMDEMVRLPSTPTKAMPRTPSKFSDDFLSQGSESDYGSLPFPTFPDFESTRLFATDLSDKENDKSALNAPRSEKKSESKKDSSLTEDDAFSLFHKLVDSKSSDNDLLDDEDESELDPSQSDSDNSYSLEDDSGDEDDYIFAPLKESKLEVPAAYYATTLAAREGFLRSEYQHLRDDKEILMRTPPKPKRKPHAHKKVAVKAFAAKYVSPTKTSSYTRSQAKVYEEARQESAKSVADWRQEFLNSINVICKKLRSKKDEDKRPSASSFNTLFLKHFTETAPDFFNQVYVQNTHVFFWNDRMIDLDLSDPDTAETNREKLAKGKNFVMFQSPQDKASIEEDDNGDFKLTDEGKIEPRVSNWLHLTQGKEGKTNYVPTDYHAGSPVGNFAKQYSGQNINIVFAGPEDIHCALHELMNRFKKSHEPSIHTIPQSYAKERPLANKEILKRLTQ